MRFLLSLMVTLSLTSAAAFAQTSLSSSINALEMKYFDHTFEGEESNDVRIDRIEKFIFGETSKGSADQRMTKIMATLASEDALPKPPAPPAPPQAAAPAAPQARGGKKIAAAPPAVPQSPAQSQDYSDDPDYDGGTKTSYPHVDALERELLGGQTHSGEPLSSRLSRLEVAAFGAASPNVDLSTRTDKLEQYAEQKLHIKPFGQNPAMQSNRTTEIIDAAPPSRNPYSAFRSLGIPFVGGSQGGYPYPTQPPSEEPEQPVHQEAPEVFAKDPPPADSPTLTKVGWCEMQVFGHTAPTMHLMARLKHLNEFLFPSDHETGMQLMDRVDYLEKAVIARKSKPQAPQL